MALFGKNKKTESVADAATTDKSEAKTSTVLRAPKAVTTVLVKPRVTEKAALLLDKNVYTFEVSMDASKYDVRDAVKKLYSVTPVKVHMVKKITRHPMSRARGRRLTEKGMKKAYVYLKEGDRIDLV